MSEKASKEKEDKLRAEVAALRKQLAGFERAARDNAGRLELVEAEFLARHEDPQEEPPKLADYEERFPGRPDIQETLLACCLDGDRYVKLRRQGQGGLGRV